MKERSLTRTDFYYMPFLFEKRKRKTPLFEKSLAKTFNAAKVNFRGEITAGKFRYSARGKYISSNQETLRAVSGKTSPMQ
ncbi:MAG: hypothetical protein KBS44_01195 [Clostridiales bacterium]|nr:hypothetical protein [Candidatus Coliplasma equi]